MNDILTVHTHTDVERSGQELTDELAEANSALIGRLQEMGRSEQRLQNRVPAFSQILWRTQPDGRMEGLQTEWSTFTGQTRNEYDGFGWSRAVHPDDEQVTKDEWTHGLADRRPFQFEHRIRRQDGVYRLLSLSVVPVLNNDGSIHEWVGVHNDITEQRKSEDELVQEAKFRFLSDSMPQMVWTATPDGWQDYCNRRWCEYTGMTVGQTQGVGWLAAVHPDDVQRSAHMWNESVITGELYESEYRIRRSRDNIYRWHLARACPLIDKQGAIAKWFGTCTDIEDYKQAEADNVRFTEELETRVYQRTAELESANGKLEISSRSLELSNSALQDFASVAAHDLQEPLRKVRAFGDRLKTGYTTVLDKQGLDYLERMLNAAARMQTLIQDLLAFSRVTSQIRPFVAVDLAHVTREVLSDLEQRILETNGRIELGDLPVIEADPVQIRQLLQNLIGNSLKFHKKDEPLIVRVHAAAAPSPDNSAWELVVEDNGIGFDEKYLDRIFTVFQRLHGRAEYDGTGVGLAICRKIAQRHGGEITARSAPNHGATFIVTLPHHPPDLSQDVSRGPSTVMSDAAEGDGTEIRSVAVYQRTY